jgi:hypothetical protein
MKIMAIKCWNITHMVTCLFGLGFLHYLFIYLFIYLFTKVKYQSRKSDYRKRVFIINVYQKLNLNAVEMLL